jgi:hypothetical protein
MPTAYEAARLNLQLFEMRREPVLREARQWLLSEFHPDTLDEAVAIIAGPRNASFRMVAGYWDMAASLVTSGAIDGGSFVAAHGEVLGTYALVGPFVEGIRRASGNRTFFWHVEQLIQGLPDAAAVLAQRRAGLRAMRRPGAEGTH